jgi:hypothetical protein
MNDEIKTLELNDSEILWLSNMMCGESDGSEASNSLKKKIDKLYQEAFNK